MATRFGANDEEEDVLAPKEPQVTSEDPDERKAARALRIKRRQEALKKASEHPEDAGSEEEAGPIEQATAQAAEELQRLQLEGVAKVTNVKVTADEREVARRFSLTEMFNNFDKKLEEQSEAAQLEYEAITRHWDAVLAIRNPLEIEEELKEQRIKCDNLLERKNKLIEELKGELKNIDASYVEDMVKQNGDIKEVSDRIEKNVTLLQKAYATQLMLIDQAIGLERSATVEYNQKRWDSLYRQRDREEMQHIEERFVQLNEVNQEIDFIDWDHFEKYKVTKMELETLIAELQKELEKLKAVCIINGEKIGYNYQVLRKREEENVFVRSEQKRKLNKMSDVINKLRAQIKKCAEDGAVEEVKSNLEIEKIKSGMKDLEMKALQFSTVNDYKFRQIWRMNACRCLSLVREVRAAEVAVHAHVLAEPPPPPPPRPPLSPLPALERELAAKSRRKRDLASVAMWQSNDDKDNTAIQEAKNRLIRHILGLVADNTGFLVENRLHKLMEDLPLTSRNLCSLDAIFMALEVSHEDDIYLLCQTFLNYAFCPICMESESSDLQTAVQSSISVVGGATTVTKSMKSYDSKRHFGKHPKSLRSGRSPNSPNASRITSFPQHGSQDLKLSESEVMLLNEAGEILSKCGQHIEGYGPPAGSELSTSEGGSTSASTRRPRGVAVVLQDAASADRLDTSPLLCPVGHNLEVEPAQVLAALGEFVGDFISPEREILNELIDDVQPRDFMTVTRRLKPEEIDEYWAKWRDMFSEDKDKMWDGLIKGLKTYFPILKERVRLHDEVSELRRRNTALRRVLRGALPEVTKQPKYMRAPPDVFMAPASIPGPVLPPIN